MVLDLPTIIALVIDALAAIVGASLFSYLSKELRLLAVYLLIGLIFTTLGFILAKHGINNLFLFHLHTLMENILISGIFILLIKSIRIRRIIVFCIIAFVSFWLFAKLSFEDIGRFDNYTSSLNSALLIIFSGYVLSRLLMDKTESISRLPEFWITTGILIYHSSCLILFSLSNLVYLWKLHNCIIPISKLFIITGFVVKWKK